MAYTFRSRSVTEGSLGMNSSRNMEEHYSLDCSIAGSQVHAQLCYIAQDHIQWVCVLLYQLIIKIIVHRHVH